MHKYLILVLSIVLIGCSQTQPTPDVGQQFYNQSQPQDEPTETINNQGTSSAEEATNSGDQAMTAEYTQATIKTSKGDIVIEFYNQDAPNFITNFTQKAESGFYDDLTFHRVEDWVIQGGDPLGNGTGGGNIETELNQREFVRGSVGVARGGNIEISNDSQFFICKSDCGFLNEQYTNFGIVTEGMDVVDSIEIGDTITQIQVE